MDSRTFDGLVQRLSRTLSRRSLVGGSLGAAVLAAVGLEQRAVGKRTPGRGGRVTAEHCLAVGERCDPPKRSGTGHRKRKKHTCEGILKKNGAIVRGCCTRYAVQDGDIRRCACKADGEACNADTARQCCSQVCTGGVCGSVSPPRCPAGADICADVVPTCAGGTCFCQPRVEGSGSACVVGVPTGCNCVDDAECNALSPGAICVAVTSLDGPCSILSGFCRGDFTSICMPPCPGGA